LDRIFGQILTDNQAMQRICKKLGFKITADEGKRTCIAEYLFKDEA
jgi:RimJ/RimL family protein N-acetyltransferase